MFLQNRQKWIEYRSLTKIRLSANIDGPCNCRSSTHGDTAWYFILKIGPLKMNEPRYMMKVYIVREGEGGEREKYQIK